MDLTVRKSILVNALKQCNSDDEEIKKLIKDLERSRLEDDCDILLKPISDNDVIATKIWTRQDVIGIAEECGLPLIYIDNVINHINTKPLVDCRDEEWDVIRDAVIEELEKVKDSF